MPLQPRFLDRFAKAELVPIGKAIDTATSARSADRLLLRRAACAKTVRTIPLGPQRTPGLSRSSPLACKSSRYS